MHCNVFKVVVYVWSAAHFKGLTTTISTASFINSGVAIKRWPYIHDELSCSHAEAIF